MFLAKSVEQVLSYFSNAIQRTLGNFLSSFPKLQADVLHVRVVVRFEASKYEVNGRPFITGQFAFYRKIGEQDVRLPVAIRFVPSEHVHLPSGNVITIFAGMDNDNPAIKYGIHSIRKEISEVLLSEVVAGIEEWKFK